jgi:predicted CoA-substrate-specific enzyme activase
LARARLEETMNLFLGVDVGAVGLKGALLVPEDMLRHVRWEGYHLVRPPRPPAQTPFIILIAPYRRTRGQPLAAMRDLLADVAGRIGDAPLGGLSLTGSGSDLVAGALDSSRCNEFQSIAGAMGLLHPHVRSVFEIGGETSKFLHLAADVEGSLTIRDYGTNGDCAAGTGGFLDQQAARLHYAVEDIGNVVREARRTAQIAGRCSVFAKSDMIHAQQKGYGPPEVLSGLCRAVAVNYKAAVVRGRRPEAPVAFIGGVSANSAVRRELAEVFALSDADLFVPPAAESMVAIGAALAAVNTPAGKPIEIPSLLARLQAAAGEAGTFQTLPPLSLDGVRLLRDQVSPYRFPSDDETIDAWLGIDIGSVGTKLALIDADGELIHSIFTRTDGRPIQVVGRCLHELEEAVGSRVRIRGVGTTGSGRELIGELVGADTINDEITCHKTGAAFVGDRLLGYRPDTIFEIGGQDSKYISLEQESAGSSDTIVVDFTMNEACAAGTGSFLEERAEELGVAIRGEFSDLALSSRTPIRLGERCTVFMERDVNTCMQRGARREDVIAGLAYSVVYNYINRVVRGRHIGDRIFFQGGTACNDAVVAAFRAVTGKEIVVPPHNAVLGAIGAALLAREKTASSSNGNGSRFRGYHLEAVDYTLREFTCKGCSNTCSIQQFTVEGEKTFWGDKCSDRFRKRARTEHKPVIPDLIALRRDLMAAEQRPEPENPRGTIGVPMTMYTWDLLPLWRTFFQGCGFKVVLSTETSRRTVNLGNNTIVAEPCFPIIVAHGHVADLVERSVDYIWLPNIVAVETRFMEKESYACPWGQTLPFVIRQAPAFRAWPGRILCPTLSPREGDKHVRSVLRKVAGDLGVSRRDADRAFAAASEAQRAFRAAYLQAGRDALETLRHTGENGIVLVGRPYNIHDAGVSLSVAAKLRDLYGVNILPVDCLPVDDIDISDVNNNMFWAYGRKILAAARLVGGHPNLHIIYITNFKCGPDSFVKAFIRPASGKPFLTLQFDGHSNDAGMMTRCEAYLDSKGILRWWRKCESDPAPKPSRDEPSTSHKWPTPAPVLPPRPFDPSASRPRSRPHPTPKR